MQFVRGAASRWCSSAAAGARVRAQDDPDGIFGGGPRSRPHRPAAPRRGSRGSVGCLPQGDGAAYAFADGGGVARDLAGPLRSAAVARAAEDPDGLFAGAPEPPRRATAPVDEGAAADARLAAGRLYKHFKALRGTDGWESETHGAAVRASRGLLDALDLLVIQGVCLGAETYYAVLAALLDAGLYRSAVRLYKQIGAAAESGANVHSGAPPPSPAASALLLKHAARRGDAVLFAAVHAPLDEAARRRRDTAALRRVSTMKIRLHAKLGEEDAAFATFDSAVAGGVRPDEAMCNSLLAACASRVSAERVVGLMERGGLSLAPQGAGVLIKLQGNDTAGAERLLAAVVGLWDRENRRPTGADSERLYGALMGVYRQAMDLDGMVGVLERVVAERLVVTPHLLSMLLRGMEEVAAAALPGSRPRRRARAIAGAVFDLAAHHHVATPRLARTIFDIYRLADDTAAARDVWRRLLDRGVYPDARALDAYRQFGPAAEEDIAAYLLSRRGKDDTRTARFRGGAAQEGAFEPFLVPQER